MEKELGKGAQKDMRLAEIVREKAAEFLQKESNRISLLTVTRVNISNDGKLITILFTVLPEHKQPEALSFVKRLRGDFRKYFIDHTRIGHVPTFDFDIDYGEKHRQKIDEIINKN
ncbi:MAG: ribosome-binding factor A [Minisyncoccia bacterium]